MERVSQDRRFHLDVEHSFYRRRLCFNNLQRRLVCVMGNSWGIHLLWGELLHGEYFCAGLSQFANMALDEYTPETNCYASVHITEQVKLGKSVPILV